MAKKKPQKIKKKAAPKTPSTPAQLAENGQGFIREGNYKKAIECYKSLIKVDDNPQWWVQLAESYRLRAYQLADKKMFAEAMASFDNNKQITGDYPDIDVCVSWLQQSKNEAKVALFYQQNQDNKTVNRLLAPSVAMQLLLNNKKVVDVISHDSILWQHSQITHKIFDAWCKSDDTAVESLLKQLPFRSAYKELAKVFKALLIIDSDPDKAHTLLQSIDNHSAFYGFADDLLTMYRCNSDDQHKLLQRPHTLLTLSKIKGWSKSDEKLWKNAQTFQKSKTAKAALQLLALVKKTLPTEQYQALLGAAFYMSEYLSDDQRFKSIPEHELLRICALQTRAKNRPDEEGYEWMAFTKCFKEMAPEQDENTQRTLAVAFSHVADLAKGQHPPTHIQCLKNSVNAYPTEAAYQALFDTSDNHRVKDLNEYVESATATFPANIGFLKRAMQAQIDSQSYKKAAKLAKRILKLDPVHQSARRALINAHLGHSCTLLSQKKLPAMEKELALALACDPVEHQLSRHYLLQALRSWASSDKPQIEHWITQAQSVFDNPLIIRLGLLVDGCAITLKTATISRQLGPIGKTADAAKVKQLLASAEYMQEQGFTIDETLMKPFVPLIKKSLSQCIDYPLVVDCCSHLYRLKLLPVLATIAKQQVKRFYVERPILLEFYELFALVNGDPTEVTGGYFHQTSSYRLESLAQRAHESGDTAVFNVIESFWVKVKSCLSGGYDFDPDYDEDDYDEDDDEFDDFPFPSDGDMSELLNPLKELKEMLSNPKTRKEAMRILDMMGVDIENLPF